MFRSMKSPLTISFFPIFFFNFCFWYFSTKLLVSGSVTFSGKVEGTRKANLVLVSNFESNTSQPTKPSFCCPQVFVPGYFIIPKKLVAQQEEAEVWSWLACEQSWHYNRLFWLPGFFFPSFFKTSFVLLFCNSWSSFTTLFRFYYWQLKTKFMVKNT